jgi:hypothetical protein
LAVESCADVTQAREVLQKGLTNSANAAQTHNHHLLITLQPVSNGSKFGDKIAILDMAGLEKGGRKSISRGKDSVANKSQEASAAVLHCLRTMMHNTNVRNGKADPIDIADDDVSEISSVSQKKDPFRRQLKSVPFRQHKVTMLLQSLFTGNGSTKVTLLLAAYPGHADYTEKRMLLQDMELLCGAALISSRGNAATGLTIHESRSTSFSDSRSTLGSCSRDEDDRSDAESARGFNNGAKHFPVLASSAGSLALSASMDEAEEVFQNPSAYAPTYSRDRDITHGRAFPTTAPVLDVPESIAPPLHTSNEPIPHKNPKYVSDFPGVQLPAKKELSDPIMERTRVTSVTSTSHVGGRSAAMPPSAGARLPERNLSKRQPMLENETTNTRHFVSNVKATRQPLSRSSIENDLPSTSESKAKKNITDQCQPPVEKDNLRSQPRAFEAISAPRQKIESNQTSGYNHPDRSIRETDRTRTESLDATTKVRELEKRMKELQRAKEEYEQKCRNLEQENENLKSTVKDAVTNAQSKWTKFDEEQFQKAREARIEDQTLVKRHFRSHLDRINYHYQIKNQWCMTDKPHFEIAIPPHFQRAEVLNIRDKMYEEKEAVALRGEENYAPPTTNDEKSEAPTSEIQAKKPKRMTISSQPPSALQALKRLAFGSN